MKASFCLLDFETSSACDLKKSGAWVYGEHDTTEILCLGYSIQGTGPFVIPADELTYGTREYVIGYLEYAVHDPECMFIAHNVAFEKSIWRNIMVKQYGWPDIPNERWHDSQASCAMRALPLKLERAAMALRLPMQKDTEGTKVTLTFSKEKLGKKLPKNTPPKEERLQRVYQYNAQDLRAELALHRRVRGLGFQERKVWLLDQQINERGVRLDMAFVSAAQRICDDASKPLAKRFTEITGLDKVGSPKFHDWLACQGVVLPNLRKEQLDKLGLNDDDEEAEDTLSDTEEDYQQKEDFALPEVCREPLRLRRILGSASIKKLRAMPFCCASDGRAHGLLQYHGAGPGRWSGRLLQPHNFPRPSLRISRGFDKEGKEQFEGHDPDQLVAAVLTGDHEYVGALFGNPIEAVASGLRHTLIAGSGNSFEVGDFSKIECVIVLALAGAVSTAERVIASGSAVYTDMATRIFGYPVTKDMLAEYTVGKASILGCGFQMGDKKFHSRYCEGQPFHFASEGVRIYREDFAPEVPKLWEELGKAANKTVWDRRAHEAYGVLYQLEDGFLTARLPSGRKLWYYDPKAEMLPMPWDENDKRPGFTYSAWKMGQWKRIKAYGGLLCLGPKTEVLTHRGFCSIVNVRPSDWLWDGEEWVTHDGVIAKGEKETIDFGGIRVTPEHKIWTGEWQQAADCSYERAVAVCEALGREEKRYAPSCYLHGVELSTREPVALSMRLREDEDCYEARLLRRGCDFMRLQYQRFKTAAKGGTAYSRALSTSGLFRVALHDRPLPITNTSGMGELWRAGHTGLSALETVREFLGGYGTFVSERLADRTYEQRRAILSRELPMGHPWRSSPEQANEYLDQYTSGPVDHVRSQPPLWYQENNALLADEERLAQREIIPVYDILNVGPRNRFVVRGKDGREIIVSNCENVVQGLARDLLVNAMFNAEADGHPVVLTVHDELITEVPSWEADEKLLCQFMCDVPQWAREIGIPVAAETWIGDRYRK